MVTITQVTARQILDSRGRPTVEASVQLSDGTLATSSVPSGAINNEKFEAVELRDNKPNEYFGYGVTQAVANVNTIISPALVGKDPLYQTQIDQALVDLDGTKNKSKLGSNAILAVSQAVMKAAAASLRLPLFVYVKEKYKLIDAYRIPTPIFNLINGGRHGSGTLDFQEFQLVPASHLPYPQALRIGVEFFLGIEKVLEQKGAITTVGLEGGFSPNLAANADALEIFSEAAKITNYTISQDAFLGIDLGPSHFYKGSKYNIKDRPQPMASKDFIKYLKDLHEQYRVFAFEDPLVADAWADWKTLTAELGETAMIVADDLVATNKTLLIKAIQEKACNAIVIKPNRIGTVTEAIEIVSIAKQAGWHTIMSHRSSETIDDFLADLAVGIGTDYVKFGAPSRGERVAKYNRLLRIEEILRSSQPESAPSTAPDSGSGSGFGPSAGTPSSLPSQPGFAPAAPLGLPTASPAMPFATRETEAAPTVGMSPVAEAAPSTVPSSSPPTNTGLPSWMSGAAMDTNNTSTGDSAAPEPSMIQSQPAAATPTPMPAGAPAVAPPVAAQPEPALPELSVTPPPMPTATPTMTAPALAPTMPAALPELQVNPAPAPTAPSFSPEPSNIGLTSPSDDAVTPPAADNIQSSLNELAQMIAPAPGMSPAAPAAPAMPNTPALTEIGASIPATPPPASTPVPMPTGAPTTAAPELSLGGLPKPVPPKY